MSLALRHIDARFQQLLDGADLVRLEDGQQLQEAALDGEQHGALHVGAIDLGTAEGQFALGKWASEQILAALYAPVKRRG